MSEETTNTRIIGLGGSMRPHSTSLRALEIALEGAQEKGAQTQCFDIRELNLPLYVPHQEPPAAVIELCNAVEQCDGMIWSSPLYHGSVSGSFKNTLDWLQVLADRDIPYLQNKVIGLVATAGGVQGLQAVNTMEFIVRALRGWAVPLVIPIPRTSRAFDEQAQLKDDDVALQLKKLGAEVFMAARQLKNQNTIDYT